MFGIDMELILQPSLPHQQTGVNAVADAFANTAIKSPVMFYANPEITLSKDGVGQNIVAIQRRNSIQPENCAYSHDASCLNLDIKMETGTGKTYVYTRTMYELHKRYGINKFIPNRSLEKVSCHFLMTAIRKTALYMLDL